MKRKHTTYLLIAYFFFIALILLMPLGWMGSPLNKITSVSWSDQLVHVLLFIPLLPLWKYTFPHHSPGKALLIAMLIAFTAEGTHYFLPYRSFEINDLIANVGGISLGLILHRILRKHGRSPGTHANK